MRKVKGIGSMLFLAVFLTAAMSLPAFAEDEEMAEIYKGIQEKNAEAVSGVVKDKDKVVSEAAKPKKPDCDIMELMKEKTFVQVSKAVRNGTASCEDLAKVEKLVLLPKFNCELNDPSLERFAAAKAKLKCGHVAEADKPDDSEKAESGEKKEPEKVEKADAKKADAGKEEEPEKAASTNLERCNSLIQKFETAKADCAVDAQSLKDAVGAAREEFEALHIPSDGMETLEVSVNSIEAVPVRCQRLADEYIRIVTEIRDSLESMPAGTQFTWEQLDLANLNPDLVNGKHVRVKTKDGKEFEGTAILVGKNLIIERDGEEDEMIPVANLSEVHLRKEVETSGGRDGSLVYIEDYHGIGDGPYLWVKGRPDSLKMLTLEISSLWFGFSGKDTFSVNNVDYKRNFRGSMPGFQLTLKSEWAFHNRVSLVYGGGFFIGWRDVNETNETQVNGQYIRNSGGLDGGPVVEVGLGVNDWVEVTFKMRGHLSPGYIAPGVGLNLTFIRGLRVGLEYVHGVDVFGTDYVPGSTFGISIGVAL